MIVHITSIYAFMGMPSGGEILVVLLVILLLFGSKNLPHMARTLGRMMEEFRRAARDVSDEILHADIESRKSSKSLPESKSPDPNDAVPDSDEDVPKDQDA